jgi:uncharacterized protein YutE (UPF0331/DUF86 family)
VDQRILIKLDEHEQALKELRSVLPQSFKEYKKSIVIKRAVERLIQINIECLIDICAILVKDLRLGVPKSEEDLLMKLESVVFSTALVERLREMKSFRNRVVHRYGDLDNKQVFDIVKDSFSDFEWFGRELREFLKSKKIH